MSNKIIKRGDGTLVHSEEERFKNELNRKRTSFASKGRNFDVDAPSAFGALQKNIQYYSKGGEGYKRALYDYNLAQSGEQAKKLGITPSQLIENPQLATDPQALAKYKGVYDTPKPQTFGTKMGTEGKILPFPQNQAEMAEYQRRKSLGEITFDGKNWKTTQPQNQANQNQGQVNTGGDQSSIVDTTNNTEETTTPTTPFNIDNLITSELNTDDLINMFSSPITQEDIDTLLNENQKLRQKFLDSLEPTNQEIQLKSDLIDLRSEIDTAKLNYRKGVDDIQQELVSTRVMAGQEQALYTQAQLGIQTLAIQESNLLSRLGLEQESKEASQKVLSATLDFNEKDITRMQKMQEQIRSQKMDLFNVMSQFSIRAQNTLGIILDGLKGIDPGDLDNNTMIKLQSLTKTAGIPWEVIQQSMKVNKDEYDYGQYVQNLGVQLKEKELMNEVDSPDNNKEIMGTVAEVKQLESEGMTSYADLFSYFDRNTKLTTTAIKNLLSEAGLMSTQDREKEFADLGATIESYKIDWKDGGDKGAGTREIGRSHV